MRSNKIQFKVESWNIHTLLQVMNNLNLEVLKQNDSVQVEF